MPAERRDEVTSEIRRIQVLVGRLRVDTTETADLLVDGEHRAKTPLTAPIRVAAGTHRIVLKNDDEVILDKEVSMAGGVETVVAPEGPEEEPDAEKGEAPAPVTEASEKPSLMKPVGFALLGTGLATAVGGAVTGGLALSKNRDLEESCPDKTNCSAQDKNLKESADSLALVTDILLPVGGVMATAGVVLVVLGSRKRTESAEGAGVVVTPVATPGAAGLMMTGRF